MKTAIISFLLFGFSLNAFAVCDHEKSLRDKSKDLCLGFTSGTTVVAVGTTIGAKTGLFSPWFMTATVVPGLVANNQCRIWKEREEQLAACMDAYRRERAAELEREQSRLDDLKRKNAQIEAINVRHDQLELEATQRHQARVRNMGAEFLRQGRNLRDAAVQAELRAAIQGLERDFAQELIALGTQRTQEINAI